MTIKMPALAVLAIGSAAVVITTGVLATSSVSVVAGQAAVNESARSAATCYREYVDAVGIFDRMVGLGNDWVAVIEMVRVQADPSDVYQAQDRWNQDVEVWTTDLGDNRYMDLCASEPRSDQMVVVAEAAKAVLAEVEQTETNNDAGRVLSVTNLKRSVATLEAELVIARDAM